MLACAVPGKQVFLSAASARAVSAYSKNSLQRNFQGLLSIVQLSRFLSFFSSDSFDSISKCFLFVKNFFIFLCFSLSLTSQLKYITTFRHRTSTLFLQVFQLFFQASVTHDIWYLHYDIIHKFISFISLHWTYYSDTKAKFRYLEKTKTTGYFPVVSG